MNKPYWTNPWDDAVPVQIEELATCVANLGKLCSCYDGGPDFVITVETVLAHWREYGDQLDAYILPHPRGYHIGIRYGNDGPEYLSVGGDTQRVSALLAKYQQCREDHSRRA